MAGTNRSVSLVLVHKRFDVRANGLLAASFSQWHVIDPFSATPSNEGHLQQQESFASRAMLSVRCHTYGRPEAFPANVVVEGPWTGQLQW